jgi:acyl-[acyl carrier protein]--UDP-N-acetylglucosamine O-acyltransferase
MNPSKMWQSQNAFIGRTNRHKNYVGEETKLNFGNAS